MSTLPALRIGIPCLFATLTLFSSAAFGQNASLEDRLQRLESEVGALRKENQQLRSELGLDGRAGQTLVKPAGREPVLSVGGMLQVQADFGDKGDARFTSGNDRFYLRRARLNLAGKFLEEFDFRIEGEFAGSLAEASAIRAQMTDGYINWNRFDFANVRVGQFKTPFGFEWEKLREQFPGKYEHAVTPVPDPDGWFHARVVVAWPKVSVFVNDTMTTRRSRAWSSTS